MKYTSTRKKIKRFLTISIWILIFAVIYSFVDARIMPSLIFVSQIEAKKIAHKVIDDAVKDCVVEMNLKSEDFFVGMEGNNKFSANTILINRLCTEVSHNINESTSIFEEGQVQVAIGAITGWDSLSNTGPKIGFSIRQVREAHVDYETEFNAVGINQTNYKVWLNAKVTFTLTNPLRSETVTSERKVMLIDTIIEGQVPERVFNM